MHINYNGAIILQFYSNKIMTFNDIQCILLYVYNAGVQFHVAVVTNGMKYDDIIVAGMTKEMKGLLAWIRGV